MGDEYLAKLLRVDLKSRRIWTEEVPREVTRDYVGGSGLAARLIWQETNAATTPFSPENRLCFMVGPVTGCVPMSGRYTVAALSPATEAWGEAHSGGRWGDELRRAGLEGIVFQGKASSPVYLYVRDGQAELRDASHVWGRDTYESSEILQTETDQEASVANIGPAGENLVRIAAVMNDGWAGRAAARGGLGAVMGSKNLKAVVVRGTSRPGVAEPERLKVVNQEALRQLVPLRHPKPSPSPAPGVRPFERQALVGNLPIRNWSRACFDEFLDLHIPYTRNFYCQHCTVGCGESHIGERGREPVWQFVAPGGSLCLVADSKAIIEANILCNRLGLDTSSTGSCIAFGMELYERGLITRQDTEGLALRWGSGEALVEMVRQIAYRKGFGHVLAEGTARAAKAIGRGAIEYAMQVKGLEIPAHDPRAYVSLAIAYATANRGACHVEAHSHPLERGTPDQPNRPDMTEMGYPGVRPRLSFEGKPQMVATMQNFVAVLNSMVICNFAYAFYRTPPSRFISWLNLSAGWNLSYDEFLHVGERIFNLKRLVNLRRGLTAADDTLPRRMLTRRPDGGDIENVPESLEALLQEYYALRGWTSAGAPKPETLARLGLAVPTATVVS